MVGQIRGGAAVPTVPGTISAILSASGAPSIEFEEALRLPAKSTKDGNDGKLDSIILDTDSIVIHARVRRDITGSRCVIEGRISRAAALRANSKIKVRENKKKEIYKGPPRLY